MLIHCLLKLGQENSLSLFDSTKTEAKDVILPAKCNVVVLKGEASLGEDSLGSNKMVALSVHEVIGAQSIKLGPSSSIVVVKVE